ncbi:MAG: glycosyltransferase family 2 protein [Kiritimatiellae bacterium]|nr:glycosyltransferase family 2 protein [Kiritimatiellia bacterium]
MASEKQNKISVIIPVYKTERFLAAALDSLVAQTYENWEAVCVNDGSPDNCIDILKEYSKRDNRIKIISQENSGVGKARNTGLKNITGKYVTFLDSDDTIDSRWLEVMAALAQEHDGDLISLSHREVPPDFSLNSCDAPLLKDFSSAKIVSGKKDCMYTLWSGNAYLNCGIWNKMWKASIVKNALFDERIKMGEDTIFVWSTSMGIKKIVEFDFVGYFYRKTPSSIMNRPHFHESMQGWHARCRKIYGLMKEYKRANFSYYPLFGFTSYVLHIFNAKTFRRLKENKFTVPENPSLLKKTMRKIILRIVWTVTLPFK